MEDLIGILFAVGFIIFKVWNGMKEGSEEAMPAPVPQTDWEEEDPEQEAEWTEEAPPATISPMQTQEEAKKVRSMDELSDSLRQAPRTERVKPATIKARQTAKPVPTQQPVPRKTDAIGHSLHTAEGARRAFVYSEIFKRKY